MKKEKRLHLEKSTSCATREFIAGTDRVRLRPTHGVSYRGIPGAMNFPCYFHILGNIQKRWSIHSPMDPLIWHWQCCQCHQRNSPNQNSFVRLSHQIYARPQMCAYTLCRRYSNEKTGSYPDMLSEWELTFQVQSAEYIHTLDVQTACRWKRWAPTGNRACYIQSQIRGQWCQQWSTRLITHNFKYISKHLCLYDML